MTERAKCQWRVEPAFHDFTPIFAVVNGAYNHVVSMHKKIPIRLHGFTCNGCGYDLSGSFLGGHCPECGYAIAKSLEHENRAVQRCATASIVCGFAAIIMLSVTPLCIAIAIYGVRYLRDARDLSDDTVIHRRWVNAALGATILGIITSLVAVGLTAWLAFLLAQWWFH